MRSLLAAVSFLTRLPVPASTHIDDVGLRRAALWYPLVGFLLGSLLYGLGISLATVLPAGPVSILLLMADAGLTGALHLDGLADMADAFGQKRTPEETLRIMRDHSIGTYGGVALLLLTMLRGACLAYLLVGHRLVILFIAPALARWSILLSSRLAAYARPTGTGAIARSITSRQFLLSTLLCLPLLALHWRLTVVSWFSVTIVTTGLVNFSKSRIGGITGDTLGATVVVSESLQLLIAVAMP